MAIPSLRDKPLSPSVEFTFYHNSANISRTSGINIVLVVFAVSYVHLKLVTDISIYTSLYVVVIQ